MSTGDNTVQVGGKSEIRRLIRAATDAGAPDRYRGKRHFSRVASALTLEASQSPGNPREIYGITMHDISEGGVAFWSRRVFSIRTPIYVREYTPAKPGVWLAAEVTHCTLGIRGYLIGVRFAITPDESPAPTGKPPGIPANAIRNWRRHFG